MAISSINDRIGVWSESLQEHAETNPYQLVKSVLSGSGGYLSLTVNDATGKITYSFNDSALVKPDRKVIAGAGLGGGGALSADVTLSLDINSMAIATLPVNTATAYLPFFNTATNQNLRATVDTITGGVTSSIPIGAIA